MNYGVKCGDCLFNHSHDYSINDLALIYGITYSRPQKQDIRSFRFLTGIEVGGGISLIDNRWKIDGEQSSYYSELVTFNPGGFFIRVYTLFSLIQ